MLVNGKDAYISENHGISSILKNHKLETLQAFSFGGNLSHS